MTIHEKPITSWNIGGLPFVQVCKTVKLRYSPWKWQGRLFTKAFGNSKIEYSEEDFTLKFDEAFIFWGVKAEMNISEIMRRLKIYLRRHRMINDANYRNSTIRR